MIAWDFIALAGLALGEPLVRGRSAVWHGVDHEVGLMTSPTVIRYNVWTAPRYTGVADLDTQKCDVTFFAQVTGVQQVRLNADGVEQLLDQSWTFNRTIKAGE